MKQILGWFPRAPEGASPSDFRFNLGIVYGDAPYECLMRALLLRQ